MSKEFLNKVLTRGVEEVIVRQHLEKALRSKKKLRVKLGIDPTAPDLHLGHTVVLRKLRQFQDLGHKAVLIIGDFTALIGDPSGRSELRPQLSNENIAQNMKNYLKEAGKVLNIKKVEVHYNSEWYKDKDVRFLMGLASKFTIARMMERDDFQKRQKENRDISVLELLYPILQGYDSIAVHADVELGGTDQKFNLLTGRKVQRRHGLPEQDVLTVPLLEGTDGVRKMSKSLGNYIGLSEKADEMYVKLMSIPDDLMHKYAYLLTDWPDELLELLKKDLLYQGKAGHSPKWWKEKLAREIVGMYHSKSAAEEAEKKFAKAVNAKAEYEDIKIVKIKTAKTTAVDLLVKVGLSGSKSEARRIIEQGGMKVNDKTIKKPGDILSLAKGDVVQRGKRHFIRIK